MNLIFACFSLANRLEDRASDGMALKMLYGERGRDALTATRVGGMLSIKAAGWLAGPGGLLMGGWAAAVTSLYGHASSINRAPTTSKQQNGSSALTHQAVCASADFIQRPIHVPVCVQEHDDKRMVEVFTDLLMEVRAETRNRTDHALHPCIVISFRNSAGCRGPSCTCAMTAIIARSCSARAISAFRMIGGLSSWSGGTCLAIS